MHKLTEQIAQLLNDRNRLTVKYSSEKIQSSIDNYICSQEDDLVVAVCELKKVQWYQFEICHVSVHPKYEGKGFASKLVNKAIEIAKEKNGRIIQCTIRENNTESERLFLRKGFQKTATFLYSTTGNNVNVYQKSISVKYA